MEYRAESLLQSPSAQPRAATLQSVLLLFAFYVLRCLWLSRQLLLDSRNFSRAPILHVLAQGLNAICRVLISSAQQRDDPLFQFVEVCIPDIFLTDVAASVYEQRGR